MVDEGSIGNNTDGLCAICFKLCGLKKVAGLVLFSIGLSPDDIYPSYLADP